MNRFEKAAEFGAMMGKAAANLVIDPAVGALLGAGVGGAGTALYDFIRGNNKNRLRRALIGAGVGGGLGGLVGGYSLYNDRRNKDFHNKRTDWGNKKINLKTPEINLKTPEINLKTPEPDAKPWHNTVVRFEKDTISDDPYGSKFWNLRRLENSTPELDEAIRGSIVNYFNVLEKTKDSMPSPSSYSFIKDPAERALAIKQDTDLVEKVRQAASDKRRVIDDGLSSMAPHASRNLRREGPAPDVTIDKYKDNYLNDINRDL